MFKPYEGKEPYIFVSYARKDMETVQPILEAMHAKGYRIWYDEGVKVMEEWRKVISDHVHDCAVLIAFHSTKSIQSKHCKSEIEYALSMEKPILSVFLADIKFSDLPHELAMYLQRFQAIPYDKSGKLSERILESVKGKEIFESCREQGQKSPSPDAPPKSKQNPNEIVAYSRGRKSREERRAEFERSRGWAVLLAIVTVGCIWYVSTHLPSDHAFLAGIIMSFPFFSGFLALLALPDANQKYNDWQIEPYRIEWYLTADYTLTVLKREEPAGKIYAEDTPGYPSHTKICRVIIESRISVICSYAFQNYTSLENVSIPDSVKIIHAHAFENCKNLREVTLSKNTKVEKYAFPPWTTIHRT